MPAAVGTAVPNATRIPSSRRRGEVSAGQPAHARRSRIRSAQQNTSSSVNVLSPLQSKRALSGGQGPVWFKQWPMVARSRTSTWASALKSQSRPAQMRAAKGSGQPRPLIRHWGTSWPSMLDPNKRSVEMNVTWGAGASGACASVTSSTGTNESVEGGIGAPISAKSTKSAPSAEGSHLRSIPVAGPVGLSPVILSPGGYTRNEPWRPARAQDDLSVSVTVAGWSGDTKASQSAGGGLLPEKPRGPRP